MNKKAYVTLSDRNGLEQVKVSLSSLMMHGDLPPDADIVLLTPSNLSASEKEWFKKKNILIQFHPRMKNGGANFFPKVYLTALVVFSKEMCSRYEQIVFVESDTLILASIRPLFRVNKFSAVAAVIDSKIVDQFFSYQEIETGKYQESLRTALSFNKTAMKRTYENLVSTYNLFNPAFNAGVFAFPTKCISNDAYADILTIVDKFAEISRYGTQGILNIYFSNKWKRLNSSYNYMINLIDKKKVFEPARIVHFAGTLSHEKPWNNHSHIFANKWASYAAIASGDREIIFNEASSLALLFTEKARFLISYIKNLTAFKKISKIRWKIIGEISRAILYVKRSISIILVSIVYRPVINSALFMTIFFKKRRKNKREEILGKVFYHSGKNDFFLTLTSLLSLDTFVPNLEYVIVQENYNIFQNFCVKKIQESVRLTILTESDVLFLFQPLLMYPYAKEFTEYGWSGKKCFLPLMKSGKNILIDSDTIFYSFPEEIHTWLHSDTKKSLFLSDYKNFSAISIVEVEYLLGKKAKHCGINSGLLCLNIPTDNRSILATLDSFIEKILVQAQTRISIDYVDRKPFAYVFPLLEQSLHWLFLEMNDSKPLSKEKYIVFPDHYLNGRSLKKACFIHYTGDVIRLCIYTQMMHSLIDWIATGFVRNNWFIGNDACYKCKHPSIPFWYFLLK